MRKLRELIVARWLEEDLTKRRILELYLNVIEWGDGVYGGEAAAQRYYGKPACRPRRRRGGGAGGDDPEPAADQPARRPRSGSPAPSGACCG